MANGVQRRESVHQPIAIPAPAPPTNGNQYSHDIHAAEVIANFNQYPIRQTMVNLSNASRTPLTYQSSHQQLSLDPLLQDVQAHSRDLVPTLLPILQTQEGDPGTRLDINNCKGTHGLPGAMMPPATSEETSRMSSPSSKSSRSSHNAGGSPLIAFKNAPAPIQQPPTIKQENSPASSIKAETPSFQTSFQFVVNENPKEARNTVRKHVMKEFRRRERWEQGQKGAPPAAVEKKPAAQRKRRRKQDTPDSDQLTPTTNEPSPPQSTISPALSRRDSQVRPQQAPSFPAEQENIILSDTKDNRSTANHSPSNGSLVAPKRQKFKPPIAPVFAESKQLQLWGAVETNYDDAIVELENKSTAPYKHDPWSAVARGQVDPFTKLKFDLGPATQSLLHHFAWVMPSLMDSIVTGKTFQRIGWLYSAVAVHDPTPVHVILGYTLGHIASLRGLEEPPQAIEHKSKAIKFLNHRMMDPKQCYSNELIGAIVNFAGWELICANPKAYAMHMSGIGRIVSARGGMSALAQDPGLETVVIRLDAIRAYITQSAPRYPAFKSVRQLEPVAINIPHRSDRTTWNSNNTDTQSLYTPWTYRYCEDALSLMSKVEDVLLLCRSAASDLSGPVGEPFQKLLIKSLEQLLQKPTILENESGGNSPTDLYAGYASSLPSSPSLPDAERLPLAKACFAIRLAALTLLDAAIKDFFDSPPKTTYYVQKLQYRFLGCRDSTNDTAWGRSLEMLIAVLMQADRMALERPWRAWYAADALTLTMRIGEWEWDEVGRTLKQWVLAGGLESIQPRIIEETTEVEKIPKGSPQSNSFSIGHDNSCRGGEDIDLEPRSNGVWNLRSIAKSFLDDWDETVTGDYAMLSDSQSSSNHGQRQSRNVNVGIGTSDPLGNGAGVDISVPMDGRGYQNGDAKHGNHHKW